MLSSVMFFLPALCTLLSTPKAVLMLAKLIQLVVAQSTVYFVDLASHWKGRCGML